MKIIIKAKTPADMKAITAMFKVGNCKTCNGNGTLTKSGMVAKSARTQGISLASIVMVNANNEITIHYSGDECLEFSKFSNRLIHGTLIGESILSKIESFEIQF